MEELLLFTLYGNAQKRGSASYEYINKYRESEIVGPRVIKYLLTSLLGAIGER